MKKVTYAFTLAGSRSVYLIGKGFVPSVAASDAARAALGEPLVYVRCDSRDAVLEGYTVSADFKGASIGDLDPEYWLRIDEEATAVAKLVLALDDMPEVLSRDLDDGAFVVDLEDGARVSWMGRHRGTRFEYTAPDRQVTDVDFDLDRMQDSRGDRTAFLDSLARNPMRWVNTVEVIGIAQLEERAA